MIKREIVNELHGPSRKNVQRRRVITRGINDLWQADLVEMGAFSKSNDGYRYLLTVIDTFSKYAWGEENVKCLPKLVVLRACPLRFMNLLFVFRRY